MVRIQVTPGSKLKLEGGTTIRRRFEFYDGGNKVQTFHLKNAWFVRGGLQLGRSGPEE